MTPLTTDRLEAGLAHIRSSPTDEGVIEMQLNVMNARAIALNARVVVPGTIRQGNVVTKMPTSLRAAV